MEPNDPKLMEQVIAIFGDYRGGGYTVVTQNGLKHVHGNKPELDALASILVQADRIENQEAREAITKAVLPPLRAALQASIGERAYAQ